MKPDIRKLVRERMTAHEARQLGLPVPADVPGVARLHFRAQRYRSVDGDGMSRGELVTSPVRFEADRAYVEIELLWRWRWEMACDVGPDAGRPADAPPVAPGSVADVLREARLMAKCARCDTRLPGCACPTCTLRAALKRFDEAPVRS